MPSTSSQTFDYSAARKAGFTDEQIAAHLASKRAAGVDVRVDRSEVQAVRAGSDPTTMTAEVNPFTMFTLGARNRALSLLPAAGGVAGGIGGAAVTAGNPWGAMAGAGAGGAAGEGLREALMGENVDPTKIGLEGAGQAAWQGIGGVIAKGAAKLAPGFMQKALGGVVPLARKFTTTSKGVTSSVLGGKYPVSEAGEGAAKTVGRGLRSAKRAAISAAPGTVGAERLASAAIRQAEENAGRPLTAAERKFVVAMVRDEANSILTKSTFGAVPKAGRGSPATPASSIVDQWGRPAIEAQVAQPPPPVRYTLREVEQIKQVAAKQARPSYKADQAATSVAADPALSKQIASSARGRLKKVPGVDALNQKIRDNMISRQAIHGALEKGTGEFMPLRVGPLSAGIQLPREKLGDIALMFSDPAFQQYMRQSPRAAAEAIQQLIYTDEPDATAR